MIRWIFQADQSFREDDAPQASKESCVGSGLFRMLSFGALHVEQIAFFRFEDVPRVRIEKRFPFRGTSFVLTSLVQNLQLPFQWDIVAILWISAPGSPQS